MNGDETDDQQQKIRKLFFLFNLRHKKIIRNLIEPLDYPF